MKKEKRLGRLQNRRRQTSKAWYTGELAVHGPLTNMITVYLISLFIYGIRNLQKKSAEVSFTDINIPQIKRYCSYHISEKIQEQYLRMLFANTLWLFLKFRVLSKPWDNVYFLISNPDVSSQGKALYIMALYIIFVFVLYIRFRFSITNFLFSQGKAFDNIYIIIHYKNK